MTKINIFFFTNRKEFINRYLDGVIMLSQKGPIEEKYSAPKNIKESDLKLVITCKPLYEKYPFFNWWNNVGGSKLEKECKRWRIKFNPKTDEITIGQVRDDNYEFLLWLQYTVFDRKTNFYDKNIKLPEPQVILPPKFEEQIRARIKAYQKQYEIDRDHPKEFEESQRLHAIEVAKWDNVRKIENENEKTFINSLVVSLNPLSYGESISLIDIFSYLFHRVAVGPIEGYSKEEYEKRVVATRNYLDKWLKRGSRFDIHYIKFYIEVFEIGEWLNTIVKVIKKIDDTNYMWEIPINLDTAKVEKKITLNKKEEIVVGAEKN